MGGVVSDAFDIFGEDTSEQPGWAQSWIGMSDPHSGYTQGQRTAARRAAEAEQKAIDRSIAAQEKATAELIASQERMQKERLAAALDAEQRAQQAEIERREWQTKENMRMLAEQEAAMMRSEERGTEEWNRRMDEIVQKYDEQVMKYEQVVQEERDFILELTEPARDLLAKAIPEYQKFIGDYDKSPLYYMQKEAGLEQLNEELSAQGLLGSGAELEIKEQFLRNLGAEEAARMEGRVVTAAQLGALGQQIPNLPSAAVMPQVISPNAPTVYTPTAQAVQAQAMPTATTEDLYPSTYGQNIAQAQYNLGQQRAQSLLAAGAVRKSLYQDQARQQRGMLQTVGTVGGGILGAWFGGPAGAAVGSSVGGAVTGAAAGGDKSPGGYKSGTSGIYV